MKPDSQRELLHLSLLPAQITAYVSTQFGVAIEYKPHSKTEIRTISGSAKIEDLFLQPPPALKNKKVLLEVSGKNTTFVNGGFSNGFPFRIMTEDASLRLINETAKAGSWERHVHYAEVYGNRKQHNWSKEKAVERAIDEVVAASIEEKRAELLNLTIPEYVDRYKQKKVLVLGDYSAAGLERLENISQTLRRLNYDPILVKDVPDNPYQSARQKVVTIGSICRFIVVDDSSKSGHILEIDVCQQNQFVMLVLRKEGEPSTFMTHGISIASNVILEDSYTSESLLEKVENATQWAENKLIELERSFKDTYPWWARRGRIYQAELEVPDPPS